MTHEEWQFEVNAAFRATWGCEKHNGRHPDEYVPPLSRISQLENKCVRCGYVFWTLPERQPRTPLCEA